jgi:hypothetical protein
MSWPTYVGPGSTPTFPRPAYMFFSRNICQRAKLFQFRPITAGNCRFWAGAAKSRLTWAGIAESQCGPERLPPGGPAPPSSRPVHPGLPATAAPGCPGLHRGPTRLGRPGASPLRWAAPVFLLSSWAPVGPQSRRCLASCQPGWAVPVRPGISPLRWAALSSVSPVLGRVGTGLAGLAGRDHSLRHGN